MNDYNDFVDSGKSIDRIDPVDCSHLAGRTHHRNLVVDWLHGGGHMPAGWLVGVVGRSHCFSRCLVRHGRMCLQLLNTDAAAHTLHAVARGCGAGAPHSHSHSHSHSCIHPVSFDSQVEESHSYPPWDSQVTLLARGSSSPHLYLQHHRRQNDGHSPYCHSDPTGSTRHRPSSPAPPLPPGHAHPAHPSTSASPAENPHSPPPAYYQTSQTAAARVHGRPGARTSASRWSGTAG